MKTVILAGGFGTRLSEYTETIPKPMVKIGNKPILWHIMKTYSYYGFNDFIICLGYKGHIIKDYFFNQFRYDSDITIDFKNNKTSILNDGVEPWKVTLIDTGEKTLTGGRLKRIKKYINEPFMLTYGDGVSDVNIKELVYHHKKQNKKITVTAVQPAGRFGGLEIKDNVNVTSFIEKKRSNSSWINGGFFVCEPEIIDYIEGDLTIFESDVLEKVASQNQLSSYKHSGFWECMDTSKEKNHLNNLWDEGNAEWKVW